MKKKWKIGDRIEPRELMCEKGIVKLSWQTCICGKCRTQFVVLKAYGEEITCVYIDDNSETTNKDAYAVIPKYCPFCGDELWFVS